jgi:rifampicin phosphotransferase
VTYSYLLPLKSEKACLNEAGGKGTNLARLALAGFPVPDGFFVTTRAYCDFIASNNLESQIQAALESLQDSDAPNLDGTAQYIRDAFQRGHIPPDLADELIGAYQSMGAPPAAVRSSATAEDLPEMSFAGQQDTYLNVSGEAALLKAMVDCWSSLWTARAIGYRIHNGVDHMSAALAVVVQCMVESQASGVLFTANPLSGQRHETVIDAAFGLGEALVSGKVEPDQYMIDMRRGEIRQKKLGAKTLSLHGQPGGGMVQHDETRKDQQALPDQQILALANMGRQVADCFGAPQDIEWAWANERLYLLQSRPITGLFPTPVTAPDEPLRIYFSFAAVQGMLDPITPLGRDTLLWFFTVSARLFGIHYASWQDCPWKTAGERLWVDATTLMCNRVGRRLFRGALSYIEPTIRQAVEKVWDEPELQPQRRGIRPRAMLQILRFYLPLMGSFIRNMQSPVRRRAEIVGRGEQLLARVRVVSSDLTGTPRSKLAHILALQSRLGQELGPMMRLFVSLIAASMASYNFVRLLTRHLPNAGDLLLELTRGLPNNPTTLMDLDLWRIASTIQADPVLQAEFERMDAHSLTRRYQSGEMSAAGQTLIDVFLAQYGGRGLAEIDLGRYRWSEDPTHVLEMLSSYLQMDRPEAAPDIVFGKGEAAAMAALEELCSLLLKKRRGWLRVRLVRFFTGRMRAMMGARESPKFFAVRLMAALRAALLAAGEELVHSGELQSADDLVYLTWSEIDAFAAGELLDYAERVVTRREAYQRELRRRQIPRLLLSDGRAFYDGLAATESGVGGMNGSPVSPGSVEGLVRIVYDPRQANLKPGEILVCPGTDPSWTPLFLTAGGLIMEVGGMMTHGAVVAREYGIPAIVSVDRATERLQTGQRIRMDGSSGVIEVLRMQGYELEE